MIFKKYKINHHYTASKTTYLPLIFFKLINHLIKNPPPRGYLIGDIADSMNKSYRCDITKNQGRMITGRFSCLDIFCNLTIP